LHHGLFPFHLNQNRLAYKTTEGAGHELAQFRFLINSALNQWQNHQKTGPIQNNLLPKSC
jgi:hypothetical protein